MQFYNVLECPGTKLGKFGCALLATPTDKSSASGRVTEVVDLTLDSDLDSDEGEVIASSYTVGRLTTASSASRGPFSLTRQAVTPARQPALLHGSASRTQPKHNLGAITESTRTKIHVTPTACLSKASAVPNTTNNGRSTPMATTHAQAQPTTPGTIGSNDAERSAKRRKLARRSGSDNGQASSQMQPRVHASANIPNKHNSQTSIQAFINAGKGSKINTSSSSSTKERIFSPYHMNSALKTNRTPVDIPEDIQTDPILLAIPIASTSGFEVTTGLPSPGSTTPESALATVIDFDTHDVDESAYIETPPPIASKVLDEELQDLGNDKLPQNSAVASRRATPATTTQAHQSVSKSSTPGRVSPVRSVKSRSVELPGLSLRQQTPQKSYQSPATPRQLTPSVSFAAASIESQTKADQSIEKADHLLIFLKEVKKLKWADITTEFAKDIPGKSYSILQTRYSHVVNRRDRTQDPATLNLPPRFAAEATIDWQTVHANTVRPRVATEVSDLGSKGQLQRHKNPAKGPSTFHKMNDQHDSSGTDSAPQRQRARRAAPVDYTWPKLRTVGGGLEVAEEDEFAQGFEPTETPKRSESPSDETLVVSDAATAASTEPLAMNLRSRDARIGLAVQRDLRNQSDEYVPYLQSSERISMRDQHKEWVWDQQSAQQWQGTVTHVDFSPTELQIVEDAIAKVIRPGRQTRHTTCRRHLRAALKDVAEPRIHQIAHEIGRHLRSRTSESIRAFLHDVNIGKISETPQIHRLAFFKPTSRVNSVQSRSVSTTIRQRELGLQSQRGWKSASRPLTYQHMNQMADSLGPSFTWTGASSDIHAVAWSPNGECFAAGAVDVTDESSMQYNKPNNLMYGDTTDASIFELGEHYIDRPRPENGANSTHAMYASQDPKLYTTVSSVAFSPSGKLMYSAGYDESVHVWSLAGSREPQLAKSWKHSAAVDILAVNKLYDGLIATASKRTTGKSVKVLRFDEDSWDDECDRPIQVNFASAKAVSRPDLNMAPTALQFESTCGELLLAGFGADIGKESGLDTSGDICLWDVPSETSLQVHGNSRNVFDVTFNPAPRYQSLFAVGCVARGNVNRGTRSLIRFYRPKDASKYSCPLELECKAYDMNDIVWCPYDENLFAAGCTDGRAYIWDLRRPDKTLRTLCHGKSIIPLKHELPREADDTGIRFLSWGQNATRLYSGSSDGVVKVWDVTRSQEDTFVKDLFTANSGIMSGAFTTDYSKLVLGEVDGTATVLEVARADVALKNADRLQYHVYSDEDTMFDMHVDIPSTEIDQTGTIEARHWLEAGQVQLAPMGGLPKRQVVQGPNYNGPFDKRDEYADSLRRKASQFQRSMAAAQGPQCSLPACENNINTTTYEDIGASQRSADRIPDELRRQWLDESVRVVLGKPNCTSCGRPARPPTDTDIAILCERCSFSCLRCGKSNNISGLTTELTCCACGGAWSVGALGYECEENPRSVNALLDVPSLHLDALDDSDTTFGDETNALTDYFFGLALDRPESPPL